MECNKDEAIRAKDIAENKMKNGDYEGAWKIALKAQKLFPQLDNISQLLAVCDIHCSAHKKIGTELDLYGILQVESNADEETIKKQYRKLALTLHPDKNRFPGAEAAFKLIGQANKILSDKGSRLSHDIKCAPKSKNHLANQTSHAGMQSGARATQFGGVNLNQQSQSGSNGISTFWTCCPFCKIKYQYYTDVKNKRLKCSKCTRPFTAIDIGVHVQQSAQPTHSSQASNTGRPKQEYVGKQGNVKVDSQRAGSSSHFGTGDAKPGTSKAKTAENGNLNTEGEKKGVESKETVREPSVVSDSIGKRSRKRPQVDITPEKKIKKTKSSDVKDKQKEAESKNDVSEPTASPNAEESMRKNKIRKKDKLKEEDDIMNVDSDSESEESEPKYIDCLEPEFSNFDKDKEEDRFAADQFWAIYDNSLDGMPRYYAQIKKVFSSPFRLKITWLEADPENPQEIVWAGEGLPVACGRFKRGDTEVTSDRLMFSHQITCQKGSKRSSLVVYPQKGEIWALYRDWDFNWSSDPESHRKNKYEIVEVLSDFDKENGVLVAYMVKLEGFVSLFQKTGRARLAEHHILSSELFRFSHRIPSTKMTGKERADVPVGSCELDTASLPDDLNEYFFSDNVKSNPKNVSTTDASCPQSPGRKVNDSDKGMCNVRRSPRGSKGNSENSNGTASKSNIPSSSKGDDPAGQDNAVNVSSISSTKGPELSSPSSGNEAIVIHDFNLDKQEWKFQEGQIWALNLGRYAQIKMIESSPIRFHVDLLELCSDAIRPNACGLYRASKGGRQVIQQDSFMYLVHAEVNGKNRFNIYPREKEVWVLNNKDETKCTLSHVDVGDCDVVEVLENNGDTIKVLSLKRVPGYKSVFRALEIQNSKEKKVLEIPLADSNRFYCRVPAFLLTVEHDGCLRGSWELDFAEFPGLLLI